MTTQLSVNLFTYSGSIAVPLAVKDLSTQPSNKHGMHRVWMYIWWMSVYICVRMVGVLWLYMFAKVR